MIYQIIKIIVNNISPIPVVIFGTHLCVYSSLSGDILYQEADAITVSGIYPVYFKSSMILVGHKGLYRPQCQSSAVVTEFGSERLIPIARHTATVWVIEFLET